MAAIFTQEFYNAWLPDVVGAQIDRADKFPGIAADTFPIQHPMARITKSLFQATHCEVKGKEYTGKRGQIYFFLERFLLARCLINRLIGRYFGVFGKIVQSEKGILSFSKGLDRFDGLKKSHGIIAKIA